MGWVGGPYASCPHGSYRPSATRSRTPSSQPCSCRASPFLLYAWPFLEARFSKDLEPHDLLDPHTIIPPAPRWGSRHLRSTSCCSSRRATTSWRRSWRYASRRSPRSTGSGPRTSADRRIHRVPAHERSPRERCRTVQPDAAIGGAPPTPLTAGKTGRVQPSCFRGARVRSRRFSPPAAGKLIVASRPDRRAGDLEDHPRPQRSCSTSWPTLNRSGLLARLSVARLLWLSFASPSG